MKKLLVEFIGTFFLVLVIALSGNPLAIGVILAVMVYMGGHISGGHYNPAVSFGAWMIKKLRTGELFGYWIVQMLGAICAAGLTIWLTGSGLVPLPAGDVTVWQAIVVEAVFTFALVLVIFNVAMSDATAGNDYYGLAIGLTILAAAYAGGPLSGGAFNPAVGIGPLLVELSQGGSVAHWWVYLVGPMAGALGATGAFNLLERKS